MKAFGDVVKMLKHSKIDVLKMDIEGSEYDVIDDILDYDIEITQIVIEFHERFFSNGKEKSIKLIKSMNKKGYKIFAVSKSYQEISFIKKSSCNGINN